ncbi:hypothetical protein Tco_0878177, partial [Tanacetum coccineum]
MGLWYSKYTGIAVTAYADAGHVRCQDTRRSTFSSAQLGDRLVSWSSKRQKSTAISTTEAEIMEQENQQQIAMDEALVPIDDQVKIGACNMRIAPEKTQKESTYQLTLDILKQYSCYNAFLKTTNVPQIYMQ